MSETMKTRLKNKAFWVSLVSAVVLLTQQLGINIFPANWADIMNTILVILTILGIVIDPTTKGILDAKTTETIEEVKTEEIK